MTKINFFGELFVNSSIVLSLNVKKQLSTYIFYN